ncbi:hypothetical protein OSB04_007448 [Centaurea solstitialis]|uniref:Uncharacterized protein n=1 Tax=Centaurea solstitialis TaxID=347529 RepID=A0AA38TJX0_9ASTR|nr:hypothetical protein OSB04_007448 [Centaurea solstitialis]
MASMVISSPSSKMAAFRLPLSLSTFPIRRRRFRVDSLPLEPFRHKSITFPPNFFSKPLLRKSRIFPKTRHSKSTDHHDHDHGHHHHCHHHHHHHGGHHNHMLTKPQQAFTRFAKAVMWTDLADFLREHLEICCFSTVLLLAAAVCPYIVREASVKPIQHVLALVAFPLVGK